MSEQNVSETAINILSVDDEKENLIFIERILNEDGVFVVSRNSGKSALEYLANHSVAVILLDIRMPEMDGFETAALIRQQKESKNTPIIFVTGEINPAEGQIAKAYSLGAVDFILKEYLKPVLKAKIAVFIELYRNTESLRQEQEDLNKQKAALETSKQQLEVLLNSAGEGLLGIDLRGSIHFANPKACRVLGLEHKDILHRKIQSFFVLENDDIKNLNAFVKDHAQSPKGLIRDWQTQQISHLLGQNLSENKQRCYWKTESGDRIYVEFTCNPTLDSAEECVGAVVMFQNISERKALEDKLIQLANYDTLTGLANRAHFHTSLIQALERQKRTDKTLAVLYLDVDHFKYINDSLGHDAGDKLLVVAADKLRENLRAADLLARLGGDEFAIALFDIEKSDDACFVARKIIETLSTPALSNSSPDSGPDSNSTKINITFSIGIAILSDKLSSLEDLIKAADTAMYVAKAEGRNNFKLYAASMQTQSEQKQRIQTLLQRAIPDNELSLVYQPKISLATKRMTSCEALLRWKPANQPSINPAVFIPNAEESGLIFEIGEWVLNTACRQISQWTALPEFLGMSVSINVSIRQLGRRKFYPLIKAALKKYNIPPHEIEIEITETGVMEHIERVIDELKKIHELGVKISIDDFGTGNSSLELLRKLPLDILKIDRSFIMDIGEDKQNEEIIYVMLAVAKTLELEVVAEGVETLEQMVFLSQAHCEVIQGYYFSKPVSAIQLGKFISASTSAFYAQFSAYHKALLQAPEEIEEPNPPQQEPDAFRVLVCEDELNISYIIQDLLGDDGFSVDIALSAKEALSMLEKKSYAAITLDLEFGKTNGLDFLREVRKSYSESKLSVIVVSSHLNEGKYRDKEQKLGISSWLAKPIDEAELHKVINRIVTDKSLALQPSKLHAKYKNSQPTLSNK